MGKFGVKKTFWGNRNEGKNRHGVYREKNECIRDLPEVGRLVVVYDEIDHASNRPFKLVSEFVPSTNPHYRTVWNIPRVFRVKEYTHGIEDPLNMANFAVLEPISRSPLPCVRIPTVQIVCGATALYEVEPRDVVTVDTSTYINGISELPVRLYPEYGPEYEKRNENGNGSETD